MNAHTCGSETQPWETVSDVAVSGCLSETRMASAASCSAHTTRMQWLLVANKLRL